MVPPPDVAARRAILAAALDQARLEHTWLAGEEPVALLGTTDSGGAIYAHFNRGVIRCTARGALTCAFEMLRLAERDVLNQQWSLGRTYYAEDTRCWDLSAGLYVPSGLPEQGVLAETVAMLRAAPERIREGRAPDAPAGPGARAVDVLPAVALALAAAGLEPETMYNGELVSVRAPVDDAVVQVDWFLDHDGTVVLARGKLLDAEPVGVDGEVLRRLNEINARLDIGGVGARFEQGAMVGWVAHRAEFFEPALDVVRWTTERAARWAEIAHRAATEA